MIRSKRVLLAALLFPIFVLMALAAFKAYVVSLGKEVVLPITAYDPRDLLAGHYLAYTVQYDVSGICVDAVNLPAYVCLDPKGFFITEPEDCKILISGVCQAGRFDAGVERFYIPEESAAILETEIRDKKASIVLSIAPGGRAQVKDLLIDGRSWKNR